MGRPKRFCHSRCRVAANRCPIPAELRNADRWIRHKNKRPITTSGTPASVTNPNQWDTFQAARKSKAGTGLGFVLGSGIGCIDLDHVIDHDGILHPTAQQLIDTLPPTWIELSPSKRGLHIWGHLPQAPGRKYQQGGIHIEKYSRDRYITITGQTWANTPLQLAELTAL